MSWQIFRMITEANNPKTAVVVPEAGVVGLAISTAKRLFAVIGKRNNIVEVPRRMKHYCGLSI
jgi:hypothetical protein